jgi:hypothetical protein
LREIIRTNDTVLISFVETLLREQAIAHIILDTNMSIMEGSLGILPRRLLVAEERFDDARRILRDAGLADELKAE